MEKYRNIFRNAKTTISLTEYEFGNDKPLGKLTYDIKSQTLSDGRKVDISKINFEGVESMYDYFLRSIVCKFDSSNPLYYDSNIYGRYFIPDELPSNTAIEGGKIYIDDITNHDDEALIRELLGGRSIYSLEGGGKLEPFTKSLEEAKDAFYKNDMKILNDFFRN